MKKSIYNRKNLYLVFIIVLVFVCSLTIVYAALSTVLKITGTAEVLSATWDIHLDNVQVKNGSVNAGNPVIIDGSTLSFDVDLNKPGDYYEFTVDVVNGGSIDAMIDSVVKSPDLTSEQAKYILYEVSYANGESISTNQTLKKNTSTPIKVRVAYRRDLIASDLPSSTDELNLSITFIYVQSDNTGSVILNNGVSVVNVVSGNGTNVGDEVCIDTECFYVILTTDEEVTMLSKYNLLVGNKYDDTNGVVPLENPTGAQDETAKGWFSGYSVDNPIIGTIRFSKINYWPSTTSAYPAYVYNENSYLYEYVENYKSYLEQLDIIINDVRLISLEELENLGCSVVNKSCRTGPNWLYLTTYWTGVADSSDTLYYVNIVGTIATNSSYGSIGVRPVITIPRSLI